MKNPQHILIFGGVLDPSNLKFSNYENLKLEGSRTPPKMDILFWFLGLADLAHMSKCFKMCYKHDMIQCSICNMKYAICNMQYAICNMHHAIFNMQYTICNMQFSVAIMFFKKLYAMANGICNMQCFCIIW
jgi:hypothetical protein